MKTNKLLFIAALFMAALSLPLFAATTSVPLGKTVVFNVSSDGTAPLTYKWFKNDVEIVTVPTNMAGLNTAKLTIVNFSAADAGIYHVAVSNSAGSVTSSKEQVAAPAAPTKIIAFTVNVL